MTYQHGAVLDRFLTALTFVALASSIRLGLEDTEKNDWRRWTIKEAPLPHGIFGVSLNAYL